MCGCCECEMWHLVISVDTLVALCLSRSLWVACELILDKCETYSIELHIRNKKFKILPKNGCRNND